MEHKARIIRFWFIAMTVALLGLWEPALWFGVVPLFFFPGCTCCGFNGCPTICSPETTQVAFTVAGIVDVACAECTNLNATHVCDRVTACNGVDGISGDFICSMEKSANYTFTLNGGNTRLTCSVMGSTLAQQFWVATLGTAPQVCSGYGAFTATFNFGLATQCDGTASTCTGTIS